MLQDGFYEVYNISNPILSPIFNNSDVDNDFAILFLDKPSSFHPIRFNVNNTLPQKGDDVFVIGWGKTESGMESPVPREANLMVLSDAECASMYAPYANITASMMCATGGSQRDACQGDSGGPLIIKGPNSTSDILVGMVSWGFDCADPSFPGVYSRIAATASWLQQYIA
jgi:secreted trypsin-like serine protease